MSEKRCKTCKFWKDDELDFRGRLYPLCVSTAIVDDCYFIGTTISPKSIFCCRHWTEKDPDLRERIADYVHEMMLLYTTRQECYTAPHEWQKDRSFRVADEMIDMFFSETAERKKKNE